MTLIFLVTKIINFKLIYRDARSHDKYQIGIVSKDSVEVLDLALQPRWGVAKFVQGYE